MDQKNNVRLLEEEKFGWTILSTVQDDTSSQEKLSAKQEPDPSLGNETDESGASTGKHEGDPSVGEQKGETENEESDEVEEFARGEEDDYADDELDEFGFDDDGDEAKALPYGGGWGRVWDSEPRREANDKEAIAEQQPEQKQGLMWRVSLVATVGFFGWVVMSGLGGGGKSIRCLKLHPCSIKDGEPAVLSSL